MKSLLISSFKLNAISRIDIAPPLNLLYIAAVFRSIGIESILHDLNLAPVSSGGDPEQEMLNYTKEALLHHEPDIVGISCLTTAHFPFMRKLAQMVRTVSPSSKIILGGVHATLFTKEIMTNFPEFDYIVIGEGEEQARELGIALLNNRGDRLDHIQSFAWRNSGGEVVINPRRNYIKDLDQIPMPAWDMIDFSQYYRDHKNWYNPKGHDIKISIPILSTRSCPYDCNFCSAHRTMGRGFRKRSAQNVVDEIQYHIETYGHRYFGFADDNLTLEKSHVLAVCDEINRRGLDIQFESYNGYNLASLDAESISALASVGCVHAILPIEHGSDMMRNEIIGKRLPREKILEIMALYKKHKIQTRAMFIMGFPEDTEETLSATLEMIQCIKPDMADIFTLIPFPGTKVFKQAIRDNLFLNKVDESMLWTGSMRLDTKGAEFYIKPYDMTYNDLARWRKTFNDISLSLIKTKSETV